LAAYFGTLVLHRAPDPRMRRTVLFATVGATLLPLFFFKYADFAARSLQGALNAVGLEAQVWTVSVLLPVGISFFTFQALSYVVDVYRGARLPERHLGVFALYVAYFPQLVAGPIERSTRLLPQFRRRQRFFPRALLEGGQLILWGLFKKLVVADNIAGVVDQIYADPAAYGHGMLALGTVLFAFQIFCDFSGYTDIAIGAARIMGFRLMENFARPYSATSIRDFWHRWHISLSTWFRDYLYKPLGGNRVSPRHHHVNLLVTFVLSGLWHGANWTFVLWGLYHGLLLVLELATARLRGGLAQRLGVDRSPALGRGVGRAVTFILVCMGWVLFRAESLGDAGYILASIGAGTAQIPFTFDLGFTVPVTFRISDLERTGIVLGLIVMWLMHRAMGERDFIGFTRAATPWQRAAIAYICLIGILFFEAPQRNEFIYFQF
jgi:D-alanyl-lipoteichoic acid acyltransferase DltB (MBOAT superfamily)